MARVMCNPRNWSDLNDVHRRMVWEHAKLIHSWSSDLVYPMLDRFDSIEQLRQVARAFRRMHGMYVYPNVIYEPPTPHHSPPSTPEYAPGN